MTPQYDIASESKVPEEHLRPSPNRYRTHVDAHLSTELPILFVWEQAIRTEDFVHWLGVRFPSLPQRFTRGTVLEGGDFKAVVGDCQPGHSFHLHYDVNLLVLEVGGSRNFGADIVRLCLDTFYSGPVTRAFGGDKKQKIRANELLSRFIKHCEIQYIGKQSHSSKSA